MKRRHFPKIAAAAPAACLAGSSSIEAAGAVLVENAVADRPVVAWAAGRLIAAITAKGARVETDPTRPHGLAIAIRASNAPLGAESLRIDPAVSRGVPVLTVTAGGDRGYVYALLELAERVRFSADAGLGLRLDSPIAEAPASRVRSIARAFVSDIEDTGWYHDDAFWPAYLDMLAASRFNRFNLFFGFGYDFPRNVTADYFQFPYPYLVDVPGHAVRVVPLADTERARNLAALKRIGAGCASRGLEFHIGIWTHAYEWTDSPNAEHRVVGLTPATHAAYCRDALAMLLRECPEITGVTLRVHGESGIPEGSYDFWQTVFEAFANAGRRIDIDMHAKGINQTMIDLATKTGQPATVAPKFSAEHQSLGYHQADIRELEIPTPERMETGVFAVSNGDRRFTRYGYADLLQDGRAYSVMFRLWPGTQRHLLSGDPALSAALGRSAGFCGASGLEICEPLTFKGREGSGHPGGRCAYADASLEPPDGDWRKFEHSYRLWGRLLYNPDTPASVWRRALDADFGSAARAAEDALANASRVLPLLTSASLPSASNRALWYEMPQNMPIVQGQRSPYSDTPEPKVLANVSPLDPQLFSTIHEHVADVLAGRLNPKYSPVEVAGWLEQWTATASAALVLAGKRADTTRAAFRRLDEDVRILVGLGRYFAAKIRSALLFAIHDATGDAAAGRLALAAYEGGREAWSTMAERAKLVYQLDVSHGAPAIRRGHWIDRLPQIDADIAAMRARLAAAPAATSPEGARAIRAVTTGARRPAPACRHAAPRQFRPGQPLDLALSVPPATGSVTVTLVYRHVNHAERWLRLPMAQGAGRLHAAIPGGYTDSPYPLQYYFELRTADAAWFYPAFNATLSNQPYYAVADRAR
jgi:hypothetical protein